MGEQVQLVLSPLLAHLSQTEYAGEAQWQEWRIRRITGGWNSLLYRVTHPLGDIAVKFSMADGRDRAGREYNALQVLEHAGLDIAPKPILLDRTGYARPVVVQEWLEGEVLDAPPASEDEWGKLIEHFALVHSIRQSQDVAELPMAVLTASSAAECKALVWDQVGKIPKEARPESLRSLLAELEQTETPEWPMPAFSLVRCDSNILNFIQRPGRWASVDWENSGWGDLAFELAELTTHAAYIQLPRSLWEQVINAYCAQVDDPMIATRAWTYRRILLVWWVARLARYLYEMPRGLDRRLAQAPERIADLQNKYERYLALAAA